MKAVAVPQQQAPKKTPICNFVRVGNLEGLQKAFEDVESKAYANGGDTLRNELRAKMVSERDTDNSTPLHYVFLCEKIESCIAIAKYLVEKGADVNAVDDDLCTPLHIPATLIRTKGKTCIPGAMELMIYLLSVGANPLLSDNQSRTAISYLSTSCTLKERESAAIVLLEKNINIDILSEAMGRYQDAAAKQPKAAKKGGGCELM